MFKVLGVIFLSVFFISDLEAMDFLCSIENSIRPTDTSCILALQGNKYFTETEEEMKRRGYSDDYVAGLDNTMENLRLAQLLRDRISNNTSIDPHTLHIPEIAALIDEHIDFIERGIKSQKHGDEADKLKLLEALKIETQERKISETVTYRYWFNLNLRLSILATHGGQVITNDQLEELYKNPKKDYIIYTLSDIRQISFLLDDFPTWILIPTRHNLGIMSFNKTYGTGVHLIGLNNDSMDADGQDNLSPALFFLHDVGHTLLVIIHRTVNDPAEFIFHFQQKLTALSNYQRKAVEHFYFQLTREMSRSLREGKQIIQNVESSMRSSSGSFLSNLISRLTASYGARQFSKLISEVNQELGLLNNE